MSSTHIGWLTMPRKDQSAVYRFHAIEGGKLVYVQMDTKGYNVGDNRLPCFYNETRYDTVEKLIEAYKKKTIPLYLFDCKKFLEAFHPEEEHNIFVFSDSGFHCVNEIIC